MKKIKNIITTTYNIRDEYYIDIVRERDEIEVWLYNKHYGIKEMLFGLADPTKTDGYLIEIINHTIEGDIAQYHIDYMR